MVITRQVLAKQLSEYLQHNVTIEQLVDWAERAMMEAEFDPVDHDTLRDIAGRIGLADVRAFGLTSGRLRSVPLAPRIPRQD
jgi:hypothetical protein